MCKIYRSATFSLLKVVILMLERKLFRYWKRNFTYGESKIKYQRGI